MSTDQENPDEITPDWLIDILARSFCSLEGVTGAGVSVDSPAQHEWESLPDQDKEFYRQTAWDLAVKGTGRPQFVRTYAKRCGCKEDSPDRERDLRDIGQFYDWAVELHVLFRSLIRRAHRQFDMTAVELKQERRARRGTVPSSVFSAEEINSGNSPFRVGDLWSRGTGQPVARIVGIQDDGDVLWVSEPAASGGAELSTSIGGGLPPPAFIHRFGSRIGKAPPDPESGS